MWGVVQLYSPFCILKSNNMKHSYETDFMAVGAHPDDVEIMAGGTIAKLTALGRTGVFVDLTAGEMGTRGTPELRYEESLAAAKVLGITNRVCLRLPDGHLQNSMDAQTLLITQIRKYKPKVILTHGGLDDHPDHCAAMEIVKSAWFKSGLVKFEAEGTAYRPERIYHFLGYPAGEPDFCVDISNYWEIKIKALQCYASQIFHSQSHLIEGKTDLSTPDFLQYIETKARYYGLRIRQKFAEGFECREIPEVDDITRLGGRRF